MVAIKDFTPRRYQETILNTITTNNTLVVLPTGLGKTKTAIPAAVHRLNTYPKSKVLFLTPTKPLAAQIHKEFIANTDLKKDEVKMLTSMTENQRKVYIKLKYLKRAKCTEGN